MLRLFLPIAVLFIILVLVILVCRIAFPGLASALDPLLAGNLVLLAATYFSFYFYWRGIENPNTQVFLRMVYSSLLVKMGTCIAAVLIYAFKARPVSKAAILIFFGLYFLYTFSEVRIITRLLKEKKNV